MAKLKKTAAKASRSIGAKPGKTARSAKTKPARGTGKTGATSKLHVAFNPKSLTESAQQIWLAGMGALTRAQAEGGKLFETLVRDGLSLEQTARQFAGRRASAVREAVEDQVDSARERAADTWDKLEKVFEERVQRALVKLGVPSRDDLRALSERVERLTEAVRKAGADKPGKAAPARAASAQTAKPKSAKSAKKATKAVSPARAPAKAAPKAAPAKVATAKAEDAPAKPAAPASEAQ